MANLQPIMTDPRLINSVLASQLEFASNYIWNKELEWVNVKLTNNWAPAQSNSNVMPGHNFQLAWVLMNSKNWKFLDETKVEKYENLGRKIMVKTLNKNIWDKKSTKKSFYREFDTKAHKVSSDNKSWWQHAEAIIALSFFYDNKESITDYVEFFEKHFVDFANGGEFFYLQSDNTPITKHAKSSRGKSAYHTVEMYRFLIENQM